jgi:hypothetical protein
MDQNEPSETAPRLCRDCVCGGMGYNRYQQLPSQSVRNKNRFRQSSMFSALSPKVRPHVTSCRSPERCPPQPLHRPRRRAGALSIGAGRGRAALLPALGAWPRRRGQDQPAGPVQPIGRAGRRGRLAPGCAQFRADSGRVPGQPGAGAGRRPGPARGRGHRPTRPRPAAGGHLRAAGAAGGLAARPVSAPTA